jgi:6-pyruvoyltetrahydropterin/6-carboxytetrahydropterin synthase
VKLGLLSEFDAAHHLPGYQGKCARVHGHTYKVEIMVEGPVGDDGFVMDFYQVKKYLNSALEEMDHKDLNYILPNPTAELIADRLFKRLKEDLKGTVVSLVSLKLWEGKNKWAMVER